MEVGGVTVRQARQVLKVLRIPESGSRLSLARTLLDVLRRALERL